MDWPRGRAPHRSDSFESYEASDEESAVHPLGKVFPEKPSRSSPISLFSANNSGTSHRGSPTLPGPMARASLKTVHLHTDRYSLTTDDAIVKDPITITLPGPRPALYT